MNAPFKLPKYALVLICIAVSWLLFYILSLVVGDAVFRQFGETEMWEALWITAFPGVIVGILVANSIAKGYANDQTAPVQQVSNPAPAPIQPAPSPASTSATAPAAPSKIEERFATLKALFESGAITKEEYEESRKKLLDKISG